MKTIGFIGLGNMAGSILKGFLDSGALPAESVLAATRTPAKLNSLKDKYPALKIVSNREAAENADILIIGTKTFDVRAIVLEFRENFKPGVHLVTINGGLEFKNLEKIFTGKHTKAIPTLASDAGAGYTLICHNEKVIEAEKDFLEKLFGKIGRVMRIAEDHFEVGADLTSCAPAFIAKIFMEFAKAGVRHSRFTEAEARELVVETLYGTAKLFREQNVDFQNLITRVATKGGISEEGLKVLDARLPGVFNELFKETLNKHGIGKNRISAQMSWFVPSIVTASWSPVGESAGNR